MNRDQIEGKWTEIKGQIREAYGDLTDDEIEQLRGDHDQLVGRLQNMVGDSKEDVRSTVDRILEKI